MSTVPVQENVYIQRVNAVTDYVREHLTDDLSLEVLTRVAGFSPFHFHRVFKAITEETVSDLVMRLRLERAASLLRATPQLSITDTALECGFKSIAVFSRAFKKHFGLNARQWDRQSPLKNSKNGQVFDDLPRYTLEHLSGFEGQAEFDVQIRALPEQRLAYVRVFNSYSDFRKIVDAYYRLINWYRHKGGLLENTTLFGMSQDDPEITPLKLCRFDWCLSVPASWQGDDEISIQTLPACDVAVIHCLGDIMQEDKALQYMFRYWLPRSRYQPANLPGMEIYRRQPIEMGWETFDIDCAIPVVEL